MSNWSRFDVEQANAKREKPSAVAATPKPSKADIVAEKAMHGLFRQWLRLNNVGFIESRMDKKSQLDVGLPDFACFTDGRCCFVEMKTATGVVSEAQELRIAFLRSIGCPVLVSRDVGEAIAWTREQLFKSCPSTGE
jgi:hypothetical protein